MGYTHYFFKKDFDNNIKFTKEEIAEFSKDIQKILDHTSVNIKGPQGNGKPIIKEDVVAFNGAYDESYESFVITVDDQHFGFCKTARKPYDVVVIASIIALKKAVGDKIEAGSDGNTRGSFEKGIELFKEAVGDESAIKAFEKDLGLLENQEERTVIK